jgi:hypothetical protein
MGNPCNDVDMSLFYSATTISIGDGKIAPFWDSPWLEGEKPKDIAPLIYKASNKKRCTVAQALHDRGWVSNIRMDANLTVHHIHEYLRLWHRLEGVLLHEGILDAISWNLTSNGEYSSASAYEAQFYGATLTHFNKMVWKIWATPKVKFFSWLAIRNRLWTADRLEKRGWDNCGLCPLCKQAQETAVHLLSHCRYTKRLWGMVRSWIGISSIHTHAWATFNTIEEWWLSMACKASSNRKALASITMLVSWTIWKERNARVFNNKAAPTGVLLEIIKNDVRLWIAAGAKQLSVVLLGE